MATESRSSAHCSAINCSNRQCKRPDLSFFKFPKEKERCQKWVQNTRRGDLASRTPVYLSTNCRLCADHFEEDQFRIRGTRNRLKWNAIPTIFNVPNPPKQTTPRRASKRKRERGDQCLTQPVKKRKVVSSVLLDHSYCQFGDDAGSSRCSSPASSQTSPGSSRSSAPRGNGLPKGKENKLLRKERLRTFRLKKRVEHLKKSMDNATKESRFIADLITGAKEYLDDTALAFFASQLRNSAKQRKKKGRRWTHSDKVVALSLYHQSPRAYQFCQRIFTLPSIQSLRRWVSSVEVRPGFSPGVMELLRDKVAAMPERDRLCVVSFDEMSLRAGLSYNISEDSVEGYEDLGSLGRTGRPANHALVFMVRGLVGKWKQAVGYFLARDATPASKLEPLLKECLKKLTDIGLRPKVIVCDQGSSNVQLYKRLGVTSEHPFFTHNDDKVFGMHDPPHLLKNTRSNLEKYIFRDESGDTPKHIRWSHIRQFYEFDSQLPIRKAPKLTKSHFDLNSFSKMRVNKAAHVLSHSVAAGVFTYAALGKLPGEAVNTAEFVEMMDSLFDSFNSRFYRETKKLKRPLSAKSSHLEFFETCLPVLGSLKVVGSKNVLFIKGWQLAISCVKELWQHLSSDLGLKYLFTSRLNQDIVENLFSTIRRKGGFRDNPSAKEFRCALRMVMVAELVKPTVGSNCSPDTDDFVVTLQALHKRKASAKTQTTWATQRSQNAVYTNVQLQLPEQNTMAYIAGYLCRRCLSGHEVLGSCRVCRDSLLSAGNEVDDPALLFIHHKAYETKSSDFGSLMVPSDEFLNFCTQCENIFRQEFTGDKMARNGICALLNKAMQSLPAYESLNLCSERVKLRLVATFVSIRVHYALKFKNRNLHVVTEKRKNKKAQKVCHK